MARIDALSIALQTDTSAKDKLAEEYGKVIANISKGTLSALLANKDLSGDPSTGTCEAKRFSNVTGQPYGTARTAREGSKLKAKPVVISIDENTEYIEEVEEKDLRMYGVNGLIEKRTANHQLVIGIDNDTRFFAVAVEAGELFTASAGATTVALELEEAIQKVETVKNEWVNGVPREMIKVICSTAFYGSVRSYLDGTQNANIDSSVGEFGQFHGVDIFSSVRLPDGINYIVMIDGAVAQPKVPSVYNPQKIGLSDATAFGIFIYKGTDAVTPDLIFYSGTTASI